MPYRHGCARPFYQSASPEMIQGFLEDFDPPDLPAPPVAAMVPHAGWQFSGGTAARVFATLKAAAPRTKTFVFLGAVHRALITQPALYPAGAWETPFGDLPVNEALALAICRTDPRFQSNAGAHDDEHAIEVSLPFIRHFFRDADFVPVAWPPGRDSVALGAMIGELAKTEGALVLASTDLTHYGRRFGLYDAGSGQGALDFVARNDKRIMAHASALAAEAIEPEARENRNACGSGALAATVSAARAMGATRGITVDYTTSHDFLQEQNVDSLVGYGGMIFA